DLAKLKALAPEILAKHWQEALDFLQILSQHWPVILKELKLSDPVLYRNARLQQVIAILTKTKPDFPIIAAGSTGSQPVTASLLKAISELPDGHVFLPALDTIMSQSAWDYIDETHPQYGMRKLLHRMEIKRENVTVIREAAS